MRKRYWGVLAAAIAVSATYGQEAAPPGARLIAEGYQFPEGPAVNREGVLFFTDVRGNKILRWDGTKTEVFLDNTNGANGLAFHKDGSLYACQGGGQAIIRVSPAGVVTKVLDAVGGTPLNRPNDLVFDFNGNLYFTNPMPRQGGQASVVRLKPDGIAEVVSTAAAYPNGIGISPDGKTLYVIDFSGNKILRHALTETGEVGPAEVHIQFDGGGPDGMAVAESGNLYVALNLASKIAVVSPTGQIIREYAFARGSGVTNACFGGDDFKTLYVTLGLKGAVYALPVDEPGLKPYSHR